MHVFYTPDIQKSNELPDEEAQHCIRVLRLNIGDEITLTDGKGRNYGSNQQTLSGSYQRDNFPKATMAVPPAHRHGTN